MKAIIFDCFGVLTTDGWLPFAQKHFGHDAALLRSAHDLNKQCDSHLIGYEDYIRQVAELARISVDAAHSEIEDNVTNAPIFEYISELKNRYKIGVLSNAGRNWLNELFTPEQVALFDAVVLSCDTGTVKPDPRMYELICQQLDTDPSEAIFIDDIERYVTGATDIGMKGIVYKDFETFKSQLESILASN